MSSIGSQIVMFFETDESCYYCLSNRKFERLGGPLDKIVTVFVHKYNVIMPRPIMT